MMNEEDIKKVYECCQNPYQRHCDVCPMGKDCCHDNVPLYVLGCAIRLLKEQPRICVFVDADGQWHPLNMGYVKPVKPIRCGSGDGSKVWYLCGKCSNCVDDKDGNRDNFCSFCGSPVDWESADT